MKIFRFAILLCVIAACAIALCGGTIKQEEEYILQEAKVYQSPMVVQTIKAQAAEPTKKRNSRSSGRKACQRRNEAKQRNYKSDSHALLCLLKM